MELYEWLLDWMAHLFQFPQEKPGTAVVLTGGQGAGKSIVGNVLKKLLGRYHVVAEKSEHVVGRFNDHLEDCLRLQCEEAFWGGSKQAAGALKHLVTGETAAIERKFGDRREVPNYTRLLVTTNEERAWPTSIDDRRLAAFSVSSERVGDLDYFEAMIRELEEGGYEKLLHTLLDREIHRTRLRRAPRTEAMERQAAESMTPEDSWLLDLLEAGEIPGVVDSDGSARVRMEDLHSAYHLTHPMRHHAKNRRAFGLWIKEHLAAEKIGRTRQLVEGRGQVRTTEYRLPPLAALRQSYSERGRGANQDWEEPHEWVTPSAFPAEGGSGEGSNLQAGTKGDERPSAGQ